MRKLRHRFLVPMVAVSALALGLTACGSGGGAPASSGAASQPAEKIKLTVGLFSDFHYAPLYEEFKKTHPNVEIVERRAQFNDHHTNLITQLTTGAGAADMVAIEGGYIGTFTPCPTSSTTSRTTAWSKRESRVPRLEVEAGRLQRRHRADRARHRRRRPGHVLPPDLFEKAGLPTDRDEVSALWPDWDVLHRDRQEVRRRRSADGAAFYDGAAQVFHAIIGQAPVGYYDTSDKVVVAANPEVRKAYDQVLQSDDRRPVRQARRQLPGVEHRLRQGPVRHHRLPGLDDSAKIQDQAKEFAGKWDVAAIPGGGGNWGGSYLTVPSRASTSRRPSS